MQDIVQTVLQKMGNVSKPQLKVWTILLTTILVLYGKVNYTNMSRYSSLSEKTYRRFLPKRLISAVSIKSWSNYPSQNPMD